MCVCFTFEDECVPLLGGQDGVYGGGVSTQLRVVQTLAAPRPGPAQAAQAVVYIPTSDILILARAVQSLSSWYKHHWTGVLTAEREASHLHGGHVVRVQAEAGLEAAVEGGHQRGVVVRVGQACRAHAHHIKLQL